MLFELLLVALTSLAERKVECDAPSVSLEKPGLLPRVADGLHRLCGAKATRAQLWHRSALASYRDRVAAVRPYLLAQLVMQFLLLEDLRCALPVLFYSCYETRSAYYNSIFIYYSIKIPLSRV